MDYLSRYQSSIPASAAASDKLHVLQFRSHLFRLPQLRRAKRKLGARIDIPDLDSGRVTFYGKSEVILPERAWLLAA
jgi:hypothetical protein